MKQGTPALADIADWAYAPAPQATDVVRIAPEYGLFIGGEFAPAARSG